MGGIEFQIVLYFVFTTIFLVGVVCKRSIQKFIMKPIGNADAKEKLVKKIKTKLSNNETNIPREKPEESVFILNQFRRENDSSDKIETEGLKLRNSWRIK